MATKKVPAPEAPAPSGPDFLTAAASPGGSMAALVAITLGCFVVLAIILILL